MGFVVSKGVTMHLEAISRRTAAQISAAGVLFLAMGVLTSGAATAATVAVTAAPGIHIVPDSANTCNGSVCIFVTGSGLNVSDWTTTVSLSRSQCSTASFLVNGVVWASGINTCGSAGDELVSDWSSPGNFANGTVLCNTWSGIAGRPCATVHS